MSPLSFSISLPVPHIIYEYLCPTLSRSIPLRLSIPVSFTLAYSLIHPLYLPFPFILTHSFVIPFHSHSSSLSPSYLYYNFYDHFFSEILSAKENIKVGGKDNPYLSSMCYGFSIQISTMQNL